MFTGALVAMVTPMHQDGSIDYETLSELVDWQIADHTDGLVILGTTGESPTIEEDERKKIIKQVVNQVSGRVPVIVGTGSNSTAHAVKLTQNAMDLGVDGALLVTPYYNKPSQEGLYQHFKTIAQAVPLPQMLYNVPSRTACDLLPETVIRLAEISNIVAIKDTTADLSRVSTWLASQCEITLLTGDDCTAMDFMLAGGQGVVSVVANIAPEWVHHLIRAAARGDRQTAQQYHERLSVLNAQLYCEANPIPLKWAMAAMGKISSGIRLPLTTLGPQYQQNVRQALQDVKLL